MTVRRDPLAEIIEETWRSSRADGLSITLTSDLIAAAVRAEILDTIGVKEAEGLAKPDHVMIQSIIGAASGQPAVQCRVGLEQWQWDVETARSHALSLLGAAEAAVHDAAMFRWLTLSDLGLDSRHAAQAINDLRRFRGDVERENWIRPEEKSP